MSEILEVKWYTGAECAVVCLSVRADCAHLFVHKKKPETTFRDLAYFKNRH